MRQNEGMKTQFSEPDVKAKTMRLLAETQTDHTNTHHLCCSFMSLFHKGGPVYWRLVAHLSTRIMLEAVRNSQQQPTDVLEQ